MIFARYNPAVTAEASGHHQGRMISHPQSISRPATERRWAGSSALPADKVPRVNETVADIVRAHRAKTMSPVGTVERTFARLAAHDDPALFIALRDQTDVVAEAGRLADEGHRDRPLYGVPVAVKDNIDVKGLPTTAACPAFSYQPAVDASAVARLKRAGAIMIGKSNLDQFATGLVGVRSPTAFRAICSIRV